MKQTKTKKERVKQYGEVFTPEWMVDKMLDYEEVRDTIHSLEAKILEPSAGEGAFLLGILKRKLQTVSDSFSQTLDQAIHYSLYALTTIYGIELLEDNLKKAQQKMMDTYQRWYEETAHSFSSSLDVSVLESARAIICANILQGNFLTEQTAFNEPITFLNWKAFQEEHTNGLYVQYKANTLTSIKNREKAFSFDFSEWSELVPITEIDKCLRSFSNVPFV